MFLLNAKAIAQVNVLVRAVCIHACVAMYLCEHVHLSGSACVCSGVASVFVAYTCTCELTEQPSELGVLSTLPPELHNENEITVARALGRFGPMWRVMETHGVFKEHS